MDFILIDNTREGARVARDLGITRFMLDFEVKGKAERQSMKISRISDHRYGDLIGIKAILNTSQLIVRIDPERDLEEQLERCIEANVDELMVPMIEDIASLERLISLAPPNINFVPLIETKFSLMQIDKIIARLKPNYLHFGLNDLHLQYNLSFMFSMFNEPQFIESLHVAREHNIRFGIGGVAPLSSNLELSSVEILMLLKNYGASGVILSRAFNQLLTNKIEEFRNEYIQITSIASKYEDTILDVSRILEKIQRIEFGHA